MHPAVPLCVWTHTRPNEKGETSRRALPYKSVCLMASILSKRNCIEVPICSGRTHSGSYRLLCAIRFEFALRLHLKMYAALSNSRTRDTKHTVSSKRTLPVRSAHLHCSLYKHTKVFVCGCVCKKCVGFIRHHCDRHSHMCETRDSGNDTVEDALINFSPLNVLWFNILFVALAS